MREICPSCGKDMVVTTEAFEVNGDAVRGIPHLLCPSCGEATFTAEQLDMVFGYRTAQKQLEAKYELQAETAFEDDESYGYPKPMDPKDVKVRIVGEVDEHGRTVLPAEEYCEEDDVYDELYPAPFASEAEACDFADAAARDATDAAEIRFLVDAETLGWLEKESARTGISLEKIASAMLRKACNETPALGAPGATVSAGRAETAEGGCDAGRRSAMTDMEKHYGSREEAARE